MIRPPPRPTLFPYPTLSRSPPPASSRSNTVTEWPARFSCCAQARPDGPEPTTATVFPVRPLGGTGKTVAVVGSGPSRSEEHTPELQSRSDLVCRLLLAKKKK